MIRRSGFGRLLTLSLLIALSLSPIASRAQTTDEPAGPPGWRAALSSGSPRLALFSVGQFDDPGAPTLIGELGHLTGGSHHAGSGLQPVARSVAVRPILGYSTNFNAGIPAENVTLGGLDFVISPPDRAKAGIVLGASAAAGASFSYARGSTVRLSAQASFETLPSHDLHRTQVAVSACAQHLLRGWTWIDACAGQGTLRRNYGDDVNQENLSLGLTRVGSTAGFDRQVSGSLILLDQGYGRQPGVAVQGIAAVPSIGAVGLDARAHRRINGELTRLAQVDLTLARPVLGRDVELGLAWSRDGGAEVFGAERIDGSVMLSVNAPLNRSLTVETGIGRRNSSIVLYDETLFSLTFNLRER